jgi:hypothetical protein
MSEATSARTLVPQPRAYISSRVRLAPILVIEAYLAFSVLFFAVSPWHYPIDDQWVLYGFLFAAQAALLAGYLRGARGAPRGCRKGPGVRTLLIVSVTVSAVLMIPTALFRTGGNFDVVGAIADPGSAYSRSNAVRAGGDPAIEYFRFVFGPVLAVCFPLSVYYWARLSLWLRVCSVVVIAGTLLTYIAMGTNKALADTVILFPWLATASHLAGVTRQSRRRTRVLVAAFVVAFGAFVFFFGRTQDTREGSSVRYGTFSAVGVSVDESSWVMRNAPSGAQTAVLGLNTYMTQGYYGLSLALREPFEWSWGVGNSMFLTRQAARLFGEDLARTPYPVRIEKYGWDSYRLWSSVYPWLASDVSFPGVVLVMFLVGRLFASVWLDTLSGRNPFAVALFALLVTALLYVPANNQVLQTGEGVSAFVGVLWAWWGTRSRHGV